jgi:shikimate dehydrogenase
MKPVGAASPAIPAHTGKTRLAGIIGWPVAHSRSPRLHGYWLSAHGIDGAYVPLPVPPDRARDAIRALSAMGFAGANVTLPHKEAALASVDRATPQARRIGAVNTIVVTADGSLEGSNTDAFGFLENLRQSVPQWRPGQGAAVLLGAGGAARAIAAALVDAGVPELRLVNRTMARAEQLAADIGGPIKPYSWAQCPAALRDAALLVNSTTLGMKGQPPLEIDPQPLPQTAIVYDIVYVPLETPLLSAARRRGLTAVDGLGMLLHQARPGFSAWFGVEPQVTAELRDFVMADLAG